MSAAAAAFLRSQIRTHIGLFFSPRAREIFEAAPVRFLPYREASVLNARAIAIPTDVPAPSVPESPWQIEFNGTRLTLWNRLPAPPGPGWRTLPGERAPLWYAHISGTLLPAWNLFGNLFDLLTFREERESERRDRHGRFGGSFSPRDGAGLLEVPAFNEAVAALVAACAGVREGTPPRTELHELLRPPVIVLSHDCDILRGNDLWTQLVRAYRVLEPLSRRRPPKVGNLWRIIFNAAFPERFYFDNATGMIDLEHTFGFRSTFYLLNGSGGRFGTRSGLAPLPRLLRAIPEGWETGVHLNYDTHLNPGLLAAQLAELQPVVGHPLTTGRAHYLRFDPEKSPALWSAHGIRCDESAGYADRVGYRCGIGGIFRMFDVSTGKPLDIYEVPMYVMESTIVEQYGDRAIPVFARLLGHLAAVGGALTMVVHPGMFHNPELPEWLGFYHRALSECRRRDARSMTAAELARACDRHRESIDG